MTKIVVMNPTGLIDKSEFLESYSDLPPVFIVSETQLTEQNIIKETRALKRKNFYSLFGCPGQTSN